MPYSIVYSSRTGNTALLAQLLKNKLPESDLLYFGAPDVRAQEAQTILVGFWTDKGSSDQAISDFLKTLQRKNIFLFGTAGFGGSDAYFTQILARVKANLDSSNTLIGAYMCQGKMPLSVRQRYEAMQVQQPQKMQQLIQNFDDALSHPNQEDLENFMQAVKRAIQKEGDKR